MLNEKTMLFNKIYEQIFEKNKLIKPYERAVLQLLSVLSRNEEKYIKYIKNTSIHHCVNDSVR